MLTTLKQLWQQAVESKPRKAPHDLALAVAGLMVEVMRMDGHLHEAERATIIGALQARFDLDAEEVEQLIARASSKVELALDMHQFTSVVVKGFSTEERVAILAELWAVAQADGHVDPYEEQLIRRAAELLGLHHTQFIEAKIQAGI